MKSEKKRSKKSLAVVLAAIMVLSVCVAGIVPVSANVASVTRELPVSVGTDEEFDVTLTQSGFLFDQGKVVETLPEGFVYVDGSYTGGKPDWVDWDPVTRNLTVWFWGDTAVTYRVTASSDEQTAVFLGRYAALVFIGLPIEEDDVGGDPEVGVDGTPPYTEQHDPEDGETGVSVDTNIVVHVKDNYVVDPNSIVMTVQSSSVTPTKTVLGLDHWLVTYDPPVDFGSGVTVVVTIDASDMAGNAMPQDVYSFTTETGVEEGSIAGNVREVNCLILPDATVELFKDAELIYTDTTDENGDYTLSASETGDYTVTVSKSGYVSETQEIPIPAVPGEYTLDFVSNDALVPEDPSMSYVLECINHWTVPPPEEECQIGMSKVLEVINAWVI